MKTQIELIIIFLQSNCLHSVWFDAALKFTPYRHSHTYGNKRLTWPTINTESKKKIAVKMFDSLLNAARNSPFKGPLTVARCDAAVAPANGDSCEFGSNKYFLLCGLGGIISCGKGSKFHFHCYATLSFFGHHQLNNGSKRMNEKKEKHSKFTWQWQLINNFFLSCFD